MNVSPSLQQSLIRVRGSGPRPKSPWLIRIVTRVQESHRGTQAFRVDVARWIQLASRAARLMVGIPDYETYVRHRLALHRGEQVLSYSEFFRERQQARYSIEKGGGFTGIC
jgi:uncharacterized short protein YbdD (DUF466 family)